MGISWAIDYQFKIQNLVPIQYLFTLQLLNTTKKKIEMSLSKFNFKVYGIKNVRISKKQDRKKERQDLFKKAIPVLDLEQKSGKKRKMSASKVLHLCSELNLMISTKVSITTTQDLDQGKV